MALSKQLIKQRITNDKSLFILINLLVNILIMVRNYLFMRALDYKELGIIALLQSIILFISILQLGVLNGGYRLLCAETEENKEKINNFFYGFVCCLTVVIFVIGGIAFLFLQEQVYFYIFLCGIFTGIFTIIKSWITNQMVASVMLRKLNFVNFISAILSVSLLSFVRYSPLTICLVSIIIQPLIFTVYILLADKSLRPTGLTFSISIFRKILDNGFVVFLTGLFLMINTQIERWSILSGLGIEALGHFYLALLFINVVGLVPNSLGNIYLPQSIKLYAGKKYLAYQKALNQYFKITVIYYCCVIAGVALFLKLFIEFFLPKYSNDLVFVYLTLPGLIIFGLSNPFAIVFNVVVEYKYYLRSYLAGTVATAGLILVLIYCTHSFSLYSLSMIKTTVNILMGCIIISGYFTICSKHPGLGFQISSK